MVEFPMSILRIFVALAAFLLSSGVLLAQDSAEVDALFVELQAEDADFARLENEIIEAWSKSGSDAMDLLLERGRAAMEIGDFPKAVEHFSALIDHAPDFAEGYNARATVYFLMGNYGLSISDVQRTLALNPRHFGALSGLGMMLEELDDPVHALQAFHAAQDLHPHMVNVNDAILRLEKIANGSAL
jgi:tetratricopeptide (TPR) repeat protein